MKKQIKALLMSIACVFATQTASAQDFYIGGAVGVGALETNYRANNLVTGEFHNTLGGGSSFIGGGILGLEHTFCNNIYAAIEGRALYSDSNRSLRRTRLADGSNFHVNRKNDFIYGGDLKLGVTLDCCVTPYLLAGVEAGKWTTKITNNTSAPIFGLAADSTEHYSKQRCAPKVGLGVRFPLCDVFAADLQYSFTWYGRTRHHLFDPVTTNEWRNKTRIDQHKFMLSLNYAFSFLTCL